MSPFGTSSKPYLSLGDNNKNNLLTFTNEDFYLQSDNYSTDSQTGLRFDVKKGIINLQNGDTIGGNFNRFSIGKLQVDNDGEVYYGNELLTDYINGLIMETITNLGIT